MHAFDILGDPVRRRILELLAAGEHASGAIVEVIQAEFGISQPAVSQHLKVLENAGLITRRVEGTKRPCRLAKEGVVGIDQWLAMLRKALAKNYDRLDEILAGMESAEKKRKKGRRNK